MKEIVVDLSYLSDQIPYDAGDKETDGIKNVDTVCPTAQNPKDDQPTVEGGIKCTSQQVWGKSEPGTEGTLTGDGNSKDNDSSKRYRRK